MALLFGLLKKGQGIDVDFDNEFIPAEKSDALCSYKNKRGYFPGVMTSGPLVIGIENRQGNSNVKLEQVEELTRMLDNIEAHGLYVRMFRADCGSFIKELVEELFLRTETFYLRASSCADRRQMYEQCKDWRHTVVNCQDMDVASFEFTEFLSDWHLRLVLQRTKKDAEHGEQFLPGMEYMYRAILTNDHDCTEEQVIDKYNQRGHARRTSMSKIMISAGPIFHSQPWRTTRCSCSLPSC